MRKPHAKVRSAAVCVSVIGFACTLGLSLPASADVITLSPTVEVAATNGASPYNLSGLPNFADIYAGGNYWGNEIGDSNGRFDTTALTINRVGSNEVTFTMTTMFNGTFAIDSNAADNVRYADLFFTPASSTLNSSWNYAVSLGYQAGSGGVSAGLYKINGASSYQTSGQIWNGRLGWVYGGAVATGQDLSGSTIQPATRVTSDATLLAGYNVNVTANAVSGGFYNVVADVTGANVDTFFKNFDVFWGTGDCSNDAIWGEVLASDATPTNGVPAPGSLALLVTGLAGAYISRKSVRGYASNIRSAVRSQSCQH